MKIHAKIMIWQTQYCEDINSPQINLESRQSQQKSKQIMLDMLIFKTYGNAKGPIAKIFLKNIRRTSLTSRFRRQRQVWKDSGIYNNIPMRQNRDETTTYICTFDIYR